MQLSRDLGAIAPDIANSVLLLCLGLAGLLYLARSRWKKSGKAEKEEI
jgi:hypothetical protein